MRSFRNLAVVFACLALWGGFATAAKKEEKPEKKTPSSKKEESRKKADAAKKDGKPQPGGKARLALPIPEGHDSKGLKIPYHDTEGRLQMTFNIGVASRLDDRHVQMNQLQVETYDDEGQPEMTISLPESVMDLETRILSTETSVTIWRADFEISGDKMQFNTDTKQGTLAGNVRMLIYNLQDEQ